MVPSQKLLDDGSYSNSLKGMKASEAAAYFWGNAIKAVQDSSKGALTVHSGKRLSTNGFKATKDFIMYRISVLRKGFCCSCLGSYAWKNMYSWLRKNSGH